MRLTQTLATTNGDGLVATVTSLPTWQQLLVGLGLIAVAAILNQVEALDDNCLTGFVELALGFAGVCVVATALFGS